MSGRAYSCTYAAPNRLTNVGGVEYTWDDNGNLLSDGVRSYQYDHANRLKQVTEASLTTQFAYNGDGVRIAKTVSETTTDYVLDLAATLPVVISDTDAIYLYGLDIIAEQLAGAGRYYYVRDGLGSVRQLLDSTGQIATRYAYDPFGVPLAGDGVPNPWQFTGEAWDAGVELLYLRARYYQAETGRFVTKDPWTGDHDRAATLNPYVYALNNPASLPDRSGYQGCMDVHCHAPIVDPALKSRADRLETEYRILVGGRQLYRDIGAVRSQDYALWSDWKALELDIVGWAARDFAAEMEGGEAAFRTKIGPVRIYKREGALVVLGEPYRGFASPFSITLAGFWWDDVSGQKWTLVHELAHWWDVGIGKNTGRLSWGMVVRGMWWRGPAECQLPRGQPREGPLEVVEWRPGRSKKGLNPREDWAESVAAYVYPDFAVKKGREISRSRWEYVAQQMNPQNPKPYPSWGWMFPARFEGSRLLPER